MKRMKRNEKNKLNEWLNKEFNHSSSAAENQNIVSKWTTSC